MKYSRQELEAVFRQGPIITTTHPKTKEKVNVGNGIFQDDLIKMGFEKPELSRMVKEKQLLKTLADPHRGRPNPPRGYNRFTPQMHVLYILPALTLNLDARSVG